VAQAQSDPRLLRGIEEFNQKLFFECHETLEEIWLEDHGDDRKFYQGIIQIAAGYFKWQQAVPAGAIKLWRSGLEKLEPYGPSHCGVHLEPFVNAVRSHLVKLEAAGQSGAAPVIDFPTIHLVC
jgi:uncharacterized protein